MSVPSRSTDATPMGRALDLTWATLNRRLRNFRTMALAAAAVALACPALAFLSPAFLLGWALLPLIGLLLVARDQALVFDWVEGVLEAWKGGLLPLGPFRSAVELEAFPMAASRKAMMASLPRVMDDFPSPDEAARELAAASARRALAELRLIRAAGLLAAVLAALLTGILFSVGWKAAALAAALAVVLAPAAAAWAAGGRRAR